MIYLVKDMTKRMGKRPHDPQVYARGNLYQKELDEWEKSFLNVSMPRSALYASLYCHHAGKCQPCF